MRDWIEAELAECQMRDTRHTKHLVQLVDRLSARPISRMPTACHGWAETVRVNFDLARDEHIKLKI